MSKRIFIMGSFILILSMATLACGVTLNLTPEPPSPTIQPTWEQIPSTIPPTQEQTSDLTPPPVISLVFNTFEETGENPPYTIIAQIPYLQGSDEPRVLLFNQLVDELLHGVIDSFRTSVLTDAPNPPFGMGSSYDLQYTLLSPAGDILSLKFEIFYYFDGAVHPNSSSLTFNYDLAAGHQLDRPGLYLVSTTLRLDFCPPAASMQK